MSKKGRSAGAGAGAGAGSAKLFMPHSTIINTDSPGRPALIGARKGAGLDGYRVAWDRLADQAIGSSTTLARQSGLR